MNKQEFENSVKTAIKNVYPFYMWSELAIDELLCCEKIFKRIFEDTIQISKNKFEKIITFQAVEKNVNNEYPTFDISIVKNNLKNRTEYKYNKIKVY